MRLWRPYLVVMLLVWVLPATVVTVLHLTLPDENADGTCEGIGFGCVPAPADQVLVLAVLCSPALIVATVVVVVAIAWRQQAGRRRPRG